MIIEKRAYLSIQHIQSAAFLTRLSSKIEEDAERYSQELFFENAAYVSGSIFMAVAFLEALINELFMDATKFPSNLKDLHPDVINSLKRIWEIGEKKFSTLEKFQTALVLAQKSPFNMGQQPYQDAGTIISLRNELIHYKPITVMFSPETGDAIQKLEKKLQAKFDVPKIFQGIQFPQKFMCHACAKWAVFSCIKFSEEFYLRMGLPVPFAFIKDRLETK